MAIDIYYQPNLRIRPKVPHCVVSKDHSAKQSLPTKSNMTWKEFNLIPYSDSNCIPSLTFSFSA